jgi:hypothetical protein
MPMAMIYEHNLTRQHTQCLGIIDIEYEDVCNNKLYWSVESQVDFRIELWLNTVSKNQVKHILLENKWQI